MSEKSKLPGTVIALGVVSLLTDLSSEMIYPLLPAFLAALGAGGAFIGLVDGVADTASSALKLWSGVWADKVKRKKPLVIVGYGIASVVRPLVTLATAPWHVLAVRFSDRIGKGIRTTPRDALVAGAIAKERRGAAFGFHRAMDNTGALLGPLVAFALVGWLGLSARTIFALAAIPAALAMAALIFGVKESDVRAEAAPAATAQAPPATGLPRSLKLFLGILAVFTLGNSSDFFLLLRAQDTGIAATAAPLLWAMLHLIKAGLGVPLSSLSDRPSIGRRRVILIGWGVYALTYLGFAAASEPWHGWALFGIYGVYYAFTEGAEKALIADLAPPALRGRAYGYYHAIIGICALPASLGFGLIRDRLGHGVAFVVGAGLAAVAAVAFALWKAEPRTSSPA